MMIVEASAEQERIVPVAPVHPVLAPPGLDEIVAPPAVDRVVTTPAEDPVIAVGWRHADGRRSDQVVLLRAFDVGVDRVSHSPTCRRRRPLPTRRRRAT